MSVTRKMIAIGRGLAFGTAVASFAVRKIVGDRAAAGRMSVPWRFNPDLVSTLGLVGGGDVGERWCRT